MRFGGSVDYTGRLSAARARMAASGLDLLVVGQPANRAYLSGFAGHDDSALRSSGWVVLSPTSGHFLTVFNYFDAVQRAMRHLEPIKAEGRVASALCDLLRKLPGRHIGFEGNWVTVDLHQILLDELGADRAFVRADDLVRGLRESKDAEELARIRAAVALTDRAYEDVIQRLRPGQSEREAAWAIERRLRELGADGMAFGPTVAAGANAAVPHHESSDARLRAGEPIWIDLGARLNGYCGDLTRSFCLGTATPEYLALWHRVLEAENATFQGIRPGQTGRDVDALARDLLAAEAPERVFGHGVGHGIGLEIHEGPWLLPTVDERVPAGAVVTIEPGLYQPGWGGIRHEDAVLVTPNGAEVLSHAPKRPVV